MNYIANPLDIFKTPTATLEGLTEYLAKKGHGYVVPGKVKARCGGPYLCEVCAEEKAQMDRFRSAQ